MWGGVERLNSIKNTAHIVSTFVKAAQAEDSGVVFWGANLNLLHFLKEFQPKQPFTVVDSDSNKHGFIPGIEVKRPNKAHTEIKQAGAIVIFTQLHSKTILENIRNQFGKIFNADSIFVIDFQS